MDSKSSKTLPPRWRRASRVILLFLWLLVSSTVGVVFFHSNPYLFGIMLYCPRLYRRLADEMIGSWLIYCQALLELFLGIKIVITGDEIRPGECNLILMNHRTRLDWLYFWSVLIRQSGVKTEKIILKGPLKHIPGAGWAMQVGAFIFIKRRWEDDKAVLSKMINYFGDLKHKTQVLLFPEGTDFSARTKAVSDEFARKNDLPAYDHCLHPRTTGFSFLAQTMRQNNDLKSVYDVTVAYPYNCPQTESQLIMGNVPREIHFHVRRYQAGALPLSEQGLQGWCQERWQEKEARLKLFKSEKFFSEEIKAHRGDASGGLTAGGQGQTRPARRPPTTASCSGGPELCEWRTRMLLRAALAYWTLFVVVITYILWLSSLARWLALAQVVFYLYMGHQQGGFENFQADYYNWFYGANKKKRE